MRPTPLRRATPQHAKARDLTPLHSTAGRIIRPEDLTLPHGSDANEPLAEKRMRFNSRNQFDAPRHKVTSATMQRRRVQKDVAIKKTSPTAPTEASTAMSLADLDISFSETLEPGLLYIVSDSEPLTPITPSLDLVSEYTSLFRVITFAEQFRSQREANQSIDDAVNSIFPHLGKKRERGFQHLEFLPIPNVKPRTRSPSPAPSQNSIGFTGKELFPSEMALSAGGRPFDSFLREEDNFKSLVSAGTQTKPPPKFPLCHWSCFEPT